MTQEIPRLPGTDELFEEMPCGLLVTSGDGTILKVNHTFCGWVGMEPVALVGLKRLQELFTMGARIFHQTHWLPLLQMQGSISEVKFDVNGKGGKKIPMLFNVIRRRSATGSYDVVSAVIAEERNKYESELLAARKRSDALVLLQQDRALFAEQMVGIVSHDLRNPLSVVTLAASGLLRSNELRTEKSKRLLANIVRAAERSRRLVDDLLDFTAARVGQGLVVTKQPTQLHPHVEKILEELGVAFPGRRIDYRSEGAGSVQIDVDRLAQLLGNLVGNAMTYGAQDGTVTVTSQVTEGQAHVAVHNRGTPIPQDMLETMFDPMVRGEGAGNSAGSVGLGLFIVRAIAAAHGGEVTVSSHSVDGTEFVVTFPR